MGYLARRLGQPAVLGELLGGILLGPTLLGAFAPQAHALLFPLDKAVATSLDALLKVGMLFFMFAAGLEVNLVHVRRHPRVIALTSLGGGAVPLVLGYAMVALFPGLWGQQSRPDLLALFIGAALSISALPVIARMLMDTRLIDTQIGATVMASAMANDVIGWSLFALILHDLSPGQADSNLAVALALVLGFAALVLGVGRWLLQPLLHQARYFKDWPGGLLTFLAALVVLAAVGAEHAGIHGIFGAFLVGVAFGQDREPDQDQRIHDMIQPFALNFFAPLYFVSVGLKADFSGQFDGPLVLWVFLVACLGKILGGSLGARLGGLSGREALAVGVGLNARGAVEIVLASVALEQRLIDQRIFVALVAMAFATTLISGPLLQRLVAPLRRTNP
ncbi:cation:proton antiporter [Methylogaea oryzae]|nr:cation:proton antiporter [Methylogaea oryzae]